MHVLLTQTVQGLGHAGTIVNVQPGYARNFLFPRRLAQTVTPEALARVRAKQQKAEHSRQRRVKDEAALITKLATISVRLSLRAHGEQLFGSVTPDVIVKALREQHGVELSKRSIELEHPIKTVGHHEIPIRLPTTAGTLRVEVLQQ